MGGPDSHKARGQWAASATFTSTSLFHLALIFFFFVVYDSRLICCVVSVVGVLRGPTVVVVIVLTFFMLLWFCWVFWGHILIGFRELCVVVLFFHSLPWNVFLFQLLFSFFKLDLNKYLFLPFRITDNLLPPLFKVSNGFTGVWLAWLSANSTQV